jgi:protein involved in polysaccharide export with SLBB domain
MHSCLFAFGAIVALLSQPTASAQNVIPGNGARASSAIPAAVPLPGAGEMAATGVVVPHDSKLIPGDEVSIKIEEDRDVPWKTIVTDTGEVEVMGNLGSVSVSGKTAAEAEAVIGSYLRQRFYNKATVSFKILRKAIGAVRPFKVNVNGKVQRNGPQYFTGANPLKLSEAVMVAGTSIYSNLKRVQLTRDGKNTTHDVQAITKEGRTELDITLQNGDQIYVDAKPVVGFGN